MITNRHAVENFDNNDSEQLGGAVNEGLISNKEIFVTVECQGSGLYFFEGFLSTSLGYGIRPKYLRPSCDFRPTEEKWWGPTTRAHNLCHDNRQLIVLAMNCNHLASKNNCV